MCGIAGAIGWVDETITRAVQRAHEQQRHRGPDADGLWAGDYPQENNVLLAHRRLSIIDLSDRAAQPMIDPTTGAVIVYNGESYNFRSLRAELEACGATFRSDSDTEVVLNAFLFWGPECVERLRGMFAFAIFHPGKRELFLARDRLGIKPLYLARVASTGGRGTVLFTSELRSLLATGLIERSLEPRGIYSYLWHGFVTGNSSIVRGVFKLDPGCTLTVSLDTLEFEKRRYWDLPKARQSSGGVQRLGDQLRQAVSMRMISDVRLGVFLSGGIDSSAVAALAVRSSQEPVSTFTVTFDESDYDESRFARAVAEGLGTDHSEVHLSESTFHEQLPQALDCIDQPTFDAINTYFVSRAVKEAGLTVALAGTGGDELFGGYRSFADLPRMCWWSRLAGFFPAELVRLGATWVARIKLGKPGAVAPQTRWGKLADVLAQDPTLANMYQYSYSLFLPDLIEEMVMNPLPEGMCNGLSAERYERLKGLTQGQPMSHGISTLELSSFIGDRLMPDTDTASMAVSLEVRVPLLDHRLVETAAQISEVERYQAMGSKQMLRNLALEGLPPSLFTRPKSGFELPFDGWCRRALREELDDTLRDPSSCEAVGLKPAVVEGIWQAFLDRAPGLYWSRIWSLFVLLRWCRRHSVTL